MNDPVEEPEQEQTLPKVGDVVSHYRPYAPEDIRKLVAEALEGRAATHDADSSAEDRQGNANRPKIDRLNFAASELRTFAAVVRRIPDGENVHHVLTEEDIEKILAADVDQEVLEEEDEDEDDEELDALWDDLVNRLFPEVFESAEEGAEFEFEEADILRRVIEHLEAAVNTVPDEQPAPDGVDPLEGQVEGRLDGPWLKKLPLNTLRSIAKSWQVEYTAEDSVETLAERLSKEPVYYDPQEPQEESADAIETPPAASAETQS